MLDKTVIVKNAARCVGCRRLIVSTHRHDYRTHYCITDGVRYSFAVDGGKDYLKRTWDSGGSQRRHDQVFEEASVQITVPLVGMGIVFEPWRMEYGS